MRLNGEDFKPCSNTGRSAKVARENINNLSFISGDNPISIYNSKHREQVYTGGKNSNILWHYRKPKNENSLITKNQDNVVFNYVMCMFGSNLKVGQDKNNINKCLIEHGLASDSYYTHIDINKEMSTYESMMLTVFNEEVIPAMKKITSGRVKVRAHIPLVDYLLTGLDQYIRNVISFKLFQTYYHKVFNRGLMLKDCLKKIASENSIDIEVESPYQNILTEEENFKQFLLHMTPSRQSDTAKAFLNKHPEFVEFLADRWSNFYNDDYYDDSMSDCSTNYSEGSENDSAHNPGYLYIVHVNKCIREWGKNKEELRHDYEMILIEKILSILRSSSNNKLHQDFWGKISVDMIKKDFNMQLSSYKEKVSRLQQELSNFQEGSQRYEELSREINKLDNKSFSPLDNFFHYGNTAEISFSNNDSNVLCIYPQDEISIFNNYNDEFKKIFGSKNKAHLLSFIPNGWMQEKNVHERVFYSDMVKQPQKKKLCLKSLKAEGVDFSEKTGNLLVKTSSCKTLYRLFAKSENSDDYFYQTTLKF